MGTQVLVLHSVSSDFAYRTHLSKRAEWIKWYDERERGGLSFHVLERGRASRDQEWPYRNGRF